MASRITQGTRTVVLGMVGAVGLGLGIILSSATVFAIEGVSQEADDILQSMSNFVGSLENFSFDYDVDMEVIVTSGEKLQFSASGEIVVRRPDGLHFVRQGPFGVGELLFDGSTITLFRTGANAFYQIDSVGTIDDAIDNLRNDLDIDAAAADLIYEQSYGGLMEGTVSGQYVGEGYVNGVRSHHLAFRGIDVDWQIWIQMGDTPLPMKYVITTKWVTGAPQYSVRLRNWSPDADADDERFAFSPASGATRIETLEVSVIGELLIGDE